MTARVVSGVLIRQFFKGGRMFDLRTSRKAHKCEECGSLIEPYEEYYSVVWVGGLGSLTFPDSVHTHCIDSYVGKGVS